jgi:hypothetical protein
MPKNNPYLTENKKPIELVQEIKDEYKVPSYEEFLKNYEPSEEAEMLTEAEYQDGVLNGPRYGPGNSDSKSITGYPSFHPIERGVREQRQRQRDEETKRVVLFVAETAAKATAVATLTTATGGLAPIIGGGAWIGGEWLKSRNDEFLQFLGKGMNELGSGMFFGGLFSNSTVGELARKSGIDLKKLENFFEIKGHVETGWAIAEHNRHRNEGVSYKSSCELCNL